MELSPAALEVLRRYKARKEEERRLSQIVFDATPEDAAAIFESEHERDAQGHAEWAARRLLEVFHNKKLDPYGELTANLDEWLLVVERRYLVKKEWVQHAMNTAVQLASKRSKSVN